MVAQPVGCTTPAPINALAPVAQRAIAMVGAHILSLCLSLTPAVCLAMPRSPPLLYSWANVCDSAPRVSCLIPTANTIPTVGH